MSEKQEPVKKSLDPNVIAALIGVAGTIIVTVISIYGNESFFSRLIDFVLLSSTLMFGGLITYELFSRFRRRFSNSIKRSYPKMSIIGIMRIRKANATLLSMTVIMISMVAYSFIEPIFNLVVNRNLIWFCSLLIILLAVEKLSFDYRIGKGLYGTNEKEARAIIQFILQESKIVEFNDRGKPKKILSQDDLDEIREYASAGLLPSIG